MPACVSLDAPFAERIEECDAAPGGHGRAYTRISSDLVQDIARAADQKGCYTSLGYRADDDVPPTCPLHRVSLPPPVEEQRWCMVG